MIKIVYRWEPNFYKVVKEAEASKLYIEGYTFHQLLTEFQDCIEKIAIMYDDEAVGIGIVWKYKPEDQMAHIGVYVEPDSRRMGYGTKIIKALGGVENKLWLIGEQQSGEFWIRQE